MNARVAVIGSGIAGLTAAYLLSRRYEVFVFETADRIGGHTHTVRADMADGSVPVDTGFIVHNPTRYPNFVRLMAELGVLTAPSNMSFAFHGKSLEWCSRGLNGLLTQRKNLLKPSFWSLWREVFRFNQAGLRLAKEGDKTLTVGDFLTRHAFGNSFRRHYLYPMTGAIWSAGLADMDTFPAITLIRFLAHHGMLGFTSQYPWRTIAGGTSRYLDPLTRPFRERIHVGAQPRAIRRSEQGMTLELEGTGRVDVAEVVIAVHGDQVLDLLAEPSSIERAVFGAFRTNRHELWLHKDIGVLPRQRRSWASWNYRESGDDSRLLLTYHMNRLQPLPTKEDLLLSMDPHGAVDEGKVLRRFVYEHPCYDLAAEKARARWSEVSGRDRIHYAGAYWGSGFHEDGVLSGVKVAESLGVPW